MNSIQILGVNGYHKTNHLKTNVLKALKELHLDLEVEEVNKVNALMESDISATPALRINGKVVVQQTVPSVEDLKILLKTLLQIKPPPFRLKKIVVPTDFSSTAEGAYRFALEMAKSEEAVLSVVHCFHPDTDPGFPYLGAHSAAFLNDKKEALKKFKTGVLPPEEGDILSTLEVEAKLLSGFPENEIVRLSAQLDTDMIVMGTTGKSGLLNQLLGSVSLHVAKKAECPVLLVPNDVQYRGFRNILFASNYESVDSKTLLRLKEFATFFQSNIHFVHIQEKEEPVDYLEVENRIFETLYEGKGPTFSITLTTVHGRSVVEGLQEYASQNDIDLVIMVAPHRNFWNNLLHKSRTKEMAKSTTFPILVYHTDYKELVIPTL